MGGRLKVLHGKNVQILEDLVLNGLKDYLKVFFWHTTVSKTKVQTKSPYTVKSRWNKGTRKRFRIRGDGHITFNTAQIEDQLIIIDRNTGKEVINSGSVRTDRVSKEYKLKSGKYRLIVRANTNPNQESNNTWYSVILNDQAYRVKRIKIKKLWGFIPYGWNRNKGPWRSGTYTPTGPRKQKSNRIKGF